jgi:hypothetical protein
MIGNSMRVSTLPLFCSPWQDYVSAGGWLAIAASSARARKMGVELSPAPDPALISNGSLRRKFNACNESASVIRLFIRNAADCYRYHYITLECPALSECPTTHPLVQINATPLIITNDRALPQASMSSHREFLLVL